jgi:hypothetical protein
MNRIILIGNGFDLAHGLKTGYQHFIDNYWYDKIKQIHFQAQTTEHNLEYRYNDDDVLISLVASNRPQLPKSIINYVTLNNWITACNEGIIKFKNVFLGQISEQLSLHNWVDIENEYYEALKSCIKNKKDIDKLNENFEYIKNALKIYLKGINDDKLRYLNLDLPYENLVKNIFSDFKKNDFSEKTKSHLTSMVPNSILLLNFNYTYTELFYSKDYQGRYDDLKTVETETIHIHGNLRDKNNPIIFGYGDEMDDDYKLIEKQDDRYLSNIKSFKYFDADNYKRLLNFISSDDYQIFIWGHSCGNSDRTLLNTLFEHDNCVSIKVFFHEKEDGTDNYSDIIRNISRHFTDKPMMRDKVVNKTLCEPLKTQ